MTRQPVDQIAAAGRPQGQDAVWLWINENPEFKLSDVSRGADVHEKTARDYIKRLVAGSIVERTSPMDAVARWRLLRPGIHTPRLRADGTPVTQGAGTMNMWRSMRMIKEFTALDLAIHSTTDVVGVTEATAKSYCSMLLRAGYLRVRQKAVPGKRPAVYQFVRNTGPKPPQIQRVKQVFDPNLQQVTYAPGGQS